MTVELLQALYWLDPRGVEVRDSDNNLIGFESDLYPLSFEELSVLAVDAYQAADPKADFENLARTFIRSPLFSRLNNYVFISNDAMVGVLTLLLTDCLVKEILNNAYEASLYIRLLMDRVEAGGGGITAQDRALVDLLYERHGFIKPSEIEV